MSVQPNRYTDGELLTPGAVAAVLYVDPKTVTRWARAGKIASIRTPGGHRRYRRADIEALRAGGAPAELLDDQQHSTVAARPLVPAMYARHHQHVQAVFASTGPASAAELAEAVAVTLELEAEASIHTLQRAQAALAAAEEAAHIGTSRAFQARARAQAESDRAAAADREPQHFPSQRRTSQPRTLITEEGTP